MKLILLNNKNFMLLNIIPVTCINVKANIEKIKNCFNENDPLLFNLLMVLIRGYIPSRYPKFGVNI